MRKTVIYITLSSFLLLLLTPVAHAQTVQPVNLIRVSPVIVNVKLDPGKTQEYRITLENLADTAVPIRMSFDSFDTDDEGSILFKQRPPAIEAWSRVEPSQLILDPKSKRTVDLQVSVPNKIPFGGYYGVLFVEPVLKNTTPGPQVAGRIGIFLFATIGTQDSDTRASIDAWTRTPGFTDKGSVATGLQVKNTQLIHFNAQPRIILDSYLGPDFELAIPEKIVFPGKTRSWKQELHMGEYPYGIYRLRILVSIGNGKQLESSQTLISLPWKAGTVLLLTGIGTVLLLTKRRQLKRALHILLKGK